MIAIFVLSACQAAGNGAPTPGTDTPAAQSQTTTPTQTAMPSATATVQSGTQYGPTNFPQNIDPLTGLAVADPSIMNRRPVLVKVSNFPRDGRPHAGLSSADIVFEYSTGAGENRFAGLYYGQNSDQVGPVRSGRYIDEWLTSMYQGILGMMFAYAPEHAELINHLGQSRVIDGTIQTCPALCDKNQVDSIYTWFANTAEMTKYYEKSTDALNSKPDLDGMVFNTEPPSGGTDGADVTLHFGANNEGQWKYDPQQKKYLRWIDNEVNTTTFNMIPLVDRNTNQQLAFSNVIILFSTYTTLNSRDSIFKVALAGSEGKAMIFRDGDLYEATWKGVDDSHPLQFFDANGKPFALQPGNSWIAIVDNLSKVTQEQTGVYTVTFYKTPYQPGY
jgi:hypothetical protein